ncbi:Do family serine endopeptidase [Methylocapsa sp. S129]|uniref:Do family serine endopeptidase n=1 Tax=Methylocapsa sp. S129 TaxID=1641869 RepID=UPI00131DD112|nr:Do family serine endopeptidase [Methylocapsa sp. S129]
MSFPHSADFRPRSLRGALLGAVAILAIGGVALESVPQFSQAALAATSASPAGPASFADVVDRVKGAVVSVKVKISEDASDDQSDRPHMPDFPPGSPMDRFFKQFGQGQDGDGDMPGMRHPHAPHLSMAQGSGFFISADGYVVTNNHVVDHATDVTVTTVDGKTIPAKVIGTDPKTDLALLKVKEGGDYPFVNFASQSPRVGDWVIAVGNPFGLGGTVTAGIVSARGRDIGSGPYDDFLQIDAPVNRGNSGGPTFNSEGEVVGVNTAIFSPSGGSVGIGFAIASDVVKSVVQSLKDHGSVARGWLGVEIQPVSADIADSLGIKEASGALVSRAQPDSPALAAGVKTGDVITSVNGEKVADPKELARKIALLGPTTTAELGILRNGAAQTISVKLGAMAGEKEAKADATTTQPSGPTELAKLGLTVEPARAGREGVTVAEVDPDGLAGQKGLQTGDIILDAGGKPVASAADITAAFDAAKASGHKAVLLRVKSGDAFRFVALSTQAAS